MRTGSAQIASPASLINSWSSGPHAETLPSRLSVFVRLPSWFVALSEGFVERRFLEEKAKSWSKEILAENFLKQKTNRRMKWSGVLVGVLVLVAVVLAEGEIWEEDEREILIRSERGTKNNKEPCRYEKGPWSDCDSKTNMRVRILTLKDRKKTDAAGAAAATCEPTKTVEKKCKKACRYEKGSWSQCSPQNEMVRTDTIKDKSDSSCEQTRQITKKCKNKGTRPSKAGKTPGARRNRQ